ncbi:FmdB family zinc ribbon protein [Thiocystis violacea]|uniref:FmdB family zinc ribbon protein n=1 Tax=Thiocystis violacea TaxID=13725 RepID=UPI0019072441|nr:zinc ribbon domain-containing protein [Thiocystis violacea]MBK1717825.1 FmdB family transcriptional regulator [Thiocystis violacea]
MPIYEYRCESCGHELERLQKISDAPLTDCPSCGRPALKKLISAAGFRLKGGGWYETDFKKDGDKKKNLHDGGEKKEAKPSETGAGASGGADKAPAAKPAETKSAA